MKNQSVRSASDVGSTTTSMRRIQGGESDFKSRLQEAIGEESVSSFSRRCGAGESLLRGYLKQGNKPGVDHLVAIADAANVNIEWLATGRGPKLRGAHQVKPDPMDKFSVPLEDVRRLRMAIEGVEEALALMKEASTPQINADLIAGAYELLQSDPKYTKNDVIRLIRLALISRTPVNVNVMS
jgi:hypothetical protein